MTFVSSAFTPTSNRRLNELIGFLALVSATLLVLSLISYSPLDPSWNTAAAPPASHPAHNWIGPVGAVVSDLALQIFGRFGFSDSRLSGDLRAALDAIAAYQLADREDRRRGMPWWHSHQGSSDCFPGNSNCEGPYRQKVCWAASLLTRSFIT